MIMRMIDMEFLLNSVLLGAGLAMDAFSVSCANGLAFPDMKGGQRIKIASTFAGFQFIMPLIGWFCVHTVLEKFSMISGWIPWISLFLLSYIGLGMIREARGKKESEEDSIRDLGAGLLITQGIATSIDALSVGFAIASYHAVMALVCSLIIALVTYVMCSVGVRIGCKIGDIHRKNALILGGCILIGIGLEIFLKNL